MTDQEFVSSLRGLAAELEPFTMRILPGGRVWDGEGYVQMEEREMDPYALMWWRILNEVAEMLERQGCPITDLQIQHLRRMLFGGMGSFSDFSIDSTKFGLAAEEANTRLDGKRTSCFQYFSHH
jgi:hypothetical protein